MKKIICFSLMFLLFFPCCVLAVGLPELYSNNVLIFDLTDDKILQEKNVDVQSNIASLTKIVTTITAIEKIDDLEKEVIISKDMLLGIPWDASVAGLKEGDLLTVEDLLYASILPSGADATQALAFTASGSISSFVGDMNSLAERVGAKNTHFVNTTGYDIPNHYSTIEDLLKIIKYSLNNPIFKKIFCTRSYELKNGKTVNSTIMMYNKMMNLDTSRILGSKTGYTSKAGLCIAAIYESHGHEILIITLQANPYIYGNFYNLRDAVKLIEFTDNNYNNHTLIKKDEIVKSIDVKLSKNEKYDIVSLEDVEMFLPNDFDRNKLEIQYDGLKEISFLNIKGSKLGKVIYKYDEEVIKEEDVLLTLKQDISILKICQSYWYIIVTIFIIVVLYLSKKKKKRHRLRKKKNLR